LPIGSVISRSRVAVVRSRKVVTEVIRNMIRNGNTPSRAGATREKVRSELKTKRSNTMSSDGTRTSMTTVRGS
jgi:hypothetical protein